MIVTKNISPINVLRWSATHVIWLVGGAALIAVLYRQAHIQFAIPWLPVSVIGTAVAFYVGFKNNSSYDRMWEARKIWGGIVNSSRSWGIAVDGFVTDLAATDKFSEEYLQETKKRLIYRHLGWLYALRSQLLVPAPWEHINQGFLVQRKARYMQERFGLGLVDDEITKIELQLFLPPDEYQRLIDSVNTATQIIKKQSQELADLRKEGLLDGFGQMQLMEILREFYEHQGKCERIKKFPLPRQYANMSQVFIGIFILLLPFSMIPELMKLGDWGFYLSIPITALIGWVYVMMELIGDYSENPFQGLVNDIPMLSLCRTIEIDLRQMLGETDLPPAIESRNGVLM